MEKNIINGWAGRLKKFFQQQTQEYVAVVRSENGDYTLLRYIRYEDRWELADSSLEKQEAWCLEVQNTVENRMVVSSVDDLAAWVAMELAKKGWQEAALIYVVPEEEVVGYLFNLPPGLDEMQQKEAAFWELDDKLAARGLNAEDFACQCEAVLTKADSSACAIIGVRRDYLQEVRAAFAAAELKLDDVIAVQGDNREELCGQKAISEYLNGKRQGFFQRQKYQPAWQRIIACWLLGMFLLLGGWTGCDVFAYEQARQQASRQTIELNRLSAEERQMEFVSSRIRAVEAREQLLRDLQAKDVSLYSVLVHFGAQTTEGVFITKLTTDDDGRRLHLEGRAADFAVLAEFVHNLEQDRDFFTRGVILENSEAVTGEKGEAGQVRFSLRINWESKDQDETDNGADKGI